MVTSLAFANSFLDSTSLISTSISGSPHHQDYGNIHPSSKSYQNDYSSTTKSWLTTMDALDKFDETFDSSSDELGSHNLTIPGRGRRDWNSSFEMETLLQLHNDFKKFDNLTAQAQSCYNPNSTSAEDDIYAFATSYKNLHGYIALFVCVFGAIANCLIMVVLTRKEMRTPVNLMLFALAIADLLIMVEYIPFALHMYLIDHGPETKYSFTSAWFVFFHVHFTQILHTISIQLTLTMAIWRYAAIKCSNRSSTFCTFKRCYQVIAAAYICPLFFCILNYLYFQIVKKTKYITQGPPPFNEIEGTDVEKLQIFTNACKFHRLHDCSSRKVDLYIVESSDLVKDYPILHTIHFWTFSVLIKLIPCVVLTFFMCWMVNTLYKARRHHKMLEQKSALPLSPVTGGVKQNGECQPLSPSKGVKIQTVIHPESDSNSNNKSHSPSRNIRLELGSIKENDSESPKAALLGPYSENGQVPLMTTTLCESPNLSLSPSPVPPHSLVSGEPDSRRASGGSGGAEGRRFTRGFIRFPSIRRPSADQGGKKKGLKRTDRTSKMLIAVLLLFLLTEFPQGIMHFLTGWYGPQFLRCNYNPWAEIWDILALINSGINFILYCFMSKQFRTQFHLSFKLDLCCRKPRWMSLANCNNNATVSTTV